MCRRYFKCLIILLSGWAAAPIVAEPLPKNIISQAVMSIRSDEFSKHDVELIRKQLGLEIGASLPIVAIDKAIRKIYQQGRFESLFIDVESVSGGVAVVLSGAKVRVLKKVEFSGVPSDIREIIETEIRLKPGEKTSQRKFKILKERVGEEFASRGYQFAHTEVNVRDIGKGEAEVEIVATPNAPTVVERVQIAGIKGPIGAELEQLIPLRKGDVFSKLKLDQGVAKIEEYLKANQYLTSRVSRADLNYSEDRLDVTISILIDLKERYQFQFTGNTVFESIALRDLIDERILSQVDANEKIAAAIKEKYRRVGYHFCRVTVKNNSEQRELLSVVWFEIDEGHRVLISKLHIRGAEAMDEGGVKDLFYESAPGVLARGVYWEEGMPKAITNLSRKLYDLGYIYNRVGTGTAVFAENKEAVELFLDVDPGVQVFVTQLEFRGFGVFHREEIAELLGVEVGEPINREKVRTGRIRILEHYNNDGYLDAKFVDTGEADGIKVLDNGKRCVVELAFVEGAKYFVGDISIEGLEKTETQVVEREMQLQPGDVYDPRLVRRSEENIAILGPFGATEIVSSQSKEHPNRKDLKVVVRETTPGLGEVGFGALYEEPRLRLRSFFGLSYRNLMGLNQTASLRTEVSLPFAQSGFVQFVEYAAVAAYRAPYPFSIPVSLVAQLGMDKYEIRVSPSTLQERIRGELRVEKKISKRIKALYRLYRFEEVKTLDRTRAEQTTSPKNPDRESIGTTGPGLVLDFRDNIFNPTKGSYHTIDVEFANPSLLGDSEFSYVMALVRNSFYVPLFSSFQLVLYAGGGYATSVFDGQKLPSARMKNELALGGLGSIRGFSVRKFNAVADDPAVIPRDAAFYNARAELNWKVFGEAGMGLFFDTGQVFPNLNTGQTYTETGSDNKLHTVRFGSPHYGVGFGIRYKTPVGPIKVDVAKGIGPDTGIGEDGESIRFYFTVGNI